VAIRLYHFTSKEKAKLIKKNGFMNSKDGGVCLSEHPTQTWGEDSRQVLLEVTLNCLKSEIDSYAKQVEVEDSTMKWMYYLIPASFLQANGNVHKVSKKRRMHLMI
jgi:hypothetical protein